MFGKVVNGFKWMILATIFVLSYANASQNANSDIAKVFLNGNTENVSQIVKKIKEINPDKGVIESIRVLNKSELGKSNELQEGIKKYQNEIRKKLFEIRKKYISEYCKKHPVKARSLYGLGDIGSWVSGDIGAAADFDWTLFGADKQVADEVAKGFEKRLASELGLPESADLLKEFDIVVTPEGYEERSGVYGNKASKDWASRTFKSFTLIMPDGKMKIYQGGDVIAERAHAQRMAKIRALMSEKRFGNAYEMLFDSRGNFNLHNQDKITPEARKALHKLMGELDMFKAKGETASGGIIEMAAHLHHEVLSGADKIKAADLLDKINKYASRGETMKHLGGLSEAAIDSDVVLGKNGDPQLREAYEFIMKYKGLRKKNLVDKYGKKLDHAKITRLGQNIEKTLKRLAVIQFQHQINETLLIENKTTRESKIKEIKGAFEADLPKELYPEFHQEIFETINKAEKLSSNEPKLKKVQEAIKSQKKLIEIERTKAASIQKLKRFLNKTYSGRKIRAVLKEVNRIKIKYGLKPNDIPLMEIAQNTNERPTLDTVKNESIGMGGKVTHYLGTAAMLVGAIEAIQNSNTDAEMAMALGHVWASSTIYGLIASETYIGVSEGHPERLAKAIMFMLVPEAAIPDLVKALGLFASASTQKLFFDDQMNAFYVLSNYYGKSKKREVCAQNLVIDGYNADALTKDLYLEGSHTLIATMHEDAIDKTKGENEISFAKAYVVERSLKNLKYYGKVSIFPGYAPLIEAAMTVKNINEQIEMIAKMENIEVPKERDHTWLDGQDGISKGLKQAIRKLMISREKEWGKIEIELAKAIKSSFREKCYAEVELDKGQKNAQKLLKEVLDIFYKLSVKEPCQKVLETEGKFNRIKYLFSSDREVQLKAMKAVLKFKNTYAYILTMRELIIDQIKAASGTYPVPVPLDGWPALVCNPSVDIANTNKLRRSIPDYIDMIENKMGSVDSAQTQNKKIAVDDECRENIFRNMLINRYRYTYYGLLSDNYRWVKNNKLYWFEVFDENTIYNILDKLHDRRSKLADDYAKYISMYKSSCFVENIQDIETGERDEEKETRGKSDKPEGNSQKNDEKTKNMKPESSTIVPKDIEKGAEATQKAGKKDVFGDTDGQKVPNGGIKTVEAAEIPQQTEEDGLVATMKPEGDTSSTATEKKQSDEKEKPIDVGNLIEKVAEGIEKSIPKIESVSEPDTTPIKVRIQGMPNSATIGQAFQLEMVGKEPIVIDRIDWSGSGIMVEHYSDRKTYAWGTEAGKQCVELYVSGKGMREGKAKACTTIQQLPSNTKFEGTIPVNSKIKTFVMVNGGVVIGTAGDEEEIQRVLEFKVIPPKPEKCNYGNRITREEYIKHQIKYRKLDEECRKYQLQFHGNNGTSYADKLTTFPKPGNTELWFNIVIAGVDIGETEHIRVFVTPEANQTVDLNTTVENPPPNKDMNESEILDIILRSSLQGKVTEGEEVTVYAEVKGGKSPYHYSWSGATTGEGDSVHFVFSAKGKKSVTVTVADNEGNTATKTLDFDIEKLDVKLQRTGNNSATVIGSNISLQALVDTKNSSGLLYRWQPNSEAKFADNETKKSTNSVKVTWTGKKKFWVEVYRKVGDALIKVGSSNILTIEAKKPKLLLSTTTKSPYLGSTVVVTVKTEPKVDDATVQLWWEIKGDVLKQGVVTNSHNDRRYSFVPKDNKPIIVTVHAKSKEEGIELGTKSLQVVAQKYSVHVSSPKRIDPAPKKWDAKLGKAVELPQSIATYQNAEVRASIKPVPKGKLQYQWTVMPAKCTISAPYSSSTYLNARQKGSYQVTVIIRDSNDIKLGSGSTTLSVTVSKRDMEVAKQKANKQKKAKKLLQEADALWKQGKLKKAIGKAAQAQRVVGKDKEVTQVLHRMNKEKKSIDSMLGKCVRLIRKAQLKKAEKLLSDAAKISKEYPRYKKTLKKLKEAQEKNRRKKEQQKMAKESIEKAKLLWSKGELARAIDNMKIARKKLPKNQKISIELLKMQKDKAKEDSLLLQAEQKLLQGALPSAESLLGRASAVNDKYRKYLDVLKLYNQSKEKQKERKKAEKKGVELLKKSRQLWKYGKLDQAVALIPEIKKLLKDSRVDTKELQTMKEQKKIVDMELQKAADAIDNNKLDLAEKLLNKASVVNKKYQKYIDLKKRLKNAKKEAKAKKEKQEREAMEELARKMAKIKEEAEQEELAREMTKIREEAEQEELAREMAKIREEAEQEELAREMAKIREEAEQEELAREMAKIREEAETRERAITQKKLIKRVAEIEKDTKVRKPERSKKTKITSNDKPLGSVKNTISSALGGYWKLISTKGSLGRECTQADRYVYSKIKRYIIDGQEGKITITHMMRKSGHIYFLVKGTWSRPPEKIYEGTTVEIPLTIEKLQEDTSEYWSGMRMSVDNADIGCGGGYGSYIGNINIDHKSPKTVHKVLKWKLGKAYQRKAGEKLTLRFCFTGGAFICGEPGWWYYYEWVPKGSESANASTKDHANKNLENATAKKAALAEKIRKIRKKAEIEANKDVIIGLWKSKKGVILKFQKDNAGKYIGFIEQVGHYTRVHFKRNEIVFRLRYIGNGKYKGTKKQRSSDYKIRYRNIMIPVKGDDMGYGQYKRMTGQ